MQLGFYDKDWSLLYTAVHKLLPLFLIVGIDKDFEKMANKIQKDAGTHQNLDEQEKLVLQIEKLCLFACE